MAKLVNMVSGGYKIVKEGVVIPANNLIPFGTLEPFTMLSFSIRHPNIRMLDGGEKQLPPLQYAENYASSTSADYYLINGIRENREASWTDDLTIQLYVKNIGIL